MVEQSGHLPRLVPRRINNSLRAKVTLAVVLPLLVVLGAFTAIQYNRQRQVLLEDLSVLASLSGEVVNTNLRRAMVNADFEQVQVVLDTLGDNDEFRVIYLMNKDGNVIFAPDSVGVGTRLNNREADCQPCHFLPVDERPASILVTTQTGERVFRSMQPIKNGPDCARCHGSGEDLLGVLLIDVYVDAAENSLNSNLRESLIWWVGAILVTVIVVNIVLERFVLSRLDSLNTAFHRLGQTAASFVLPATSYDEMGQLMAAFNHMVHQVRERESDVRNLSENLRKHNLKRGELLYRVIQAQEEERKRVARELHDELGQSLSGLALRAEAMGQLLESDRERAFDKLSQIRTLTKDTMNRMYDLIWDLRPPALDDLGLPVAIRMFAEQTFSDYAGKITMDLDTFQNRLSAETEITIYRICQEALNNVVRHSGADTVHVAMHRNGTTLRVEIVDNGQGFDPSKIELNGHDGRGLGILGMQERALQHKGHITIQSSPGTGTRVILEVPMGEQDHE